jgi:hypothetical protein
MLAATQIKAGKAAFLNNITRAKPKTKSNIPVTQNIKSPVNMVLTVIKCD